MSPSTRLPILTITPAVAEEMSGQADGSGPVNQDEITSTAQSDTASDWTLPLVVSAVALLLSLISTAVAAWRRGWRPNSELEAESATTHEDVNV